MKKKKAFTLVEILIVVAVVCVIFVVLASRVDFATDKAKTSGTQTDLRSYQVALKTVAIEQQGFSEDIVELANLLNKNLDSKMQVIVSEDGKLETMATDAWGNPYILEYTKPANSAGQIMIKSAGKDGKYETGDDVASIVKCELTSSGTNVVIENVEPSSTPNVPVQPDTPEVHVCVYNQTIQSSSYLHAAGNCVSTATYYYSCECGAKSSETFDGSKDYNTHVAITKTYSGLNELQHKVSSTCSGCSSPLNTSNENHLFVDDRCILCNYVHHVHNFSKQVTTERYKKSDATCTEKEAYYYSCNCGEVGTEYFEIGSALNHDYRTEILQQASCTQAGSKRIYCTRCDYSQNATIEILPHSFTDAVKEEYKFSDATCKESAKYYRSCYRCGQKNDTLFVAGNKDFSNHIGRAINSISYFDELTHIVATKCEECKNIINSTYQVHSYDENRNCIACNYHYHVYNVENNNNVKAYGTCISPATYYYECVCGDVGSLTYEGLKDLSVHAGSIVNGSKKDSHLQYSCCEFVVDTEHSFEDSILNPATCTEKGTTKYSCACGYYYTEQNIAVVDHNYNQYSIDSDYLKLEATCQNAATYYKSCICGKAGTTTFVSGAKKPHTFETIGTFDACEKCSACNYVQSSHNYDSSIAFESTCTSMGSTKYSCDCGYNYTVQNIKPLGHKDMDNNDKCERCEAELVRVDGLGDVSISKPSNKNPDNIPDVNITYNPEDGGVVGEVPPVNMEPEIPDELPETVLPNYIEFTGGTFNPKTNYTPGEYETVPWTVTIIQTKLPVSYTINYWSKFFVTVDEDGNVLKTEANGISFADIEQQYSRYVVYRFSNENALVLNDVAGDTVEIYAIYNSSEDSLENAIYMAAYFNRQHSSSDFYVAELINGVYQDANVANEISKIDSFTTTTIYSGTREVMVTAPSANTEYVYIPGSTFKAVAGMTWGEWLESEYNTTGMANPIIKTSDYQTVSYDSVIVPGESYGFIEKEASLSVGFIHNEEMTFLFTPFVFKPGMTWGEFIDSEYNVTIGTNNKLFTIDDNGYVICLLEYMCPSFGGNTHIKSDDKLEHPAVYTFESGSQKVFLDTGRMNLCNVLGEHIECTYTYDGNVYCVRCGEIINGDIGTFTIDGKQFTFEYGMTWGEWIESDYNTGNYAINYDDYVWVEYVTYIFADSKYTIFCHKDDMILSSSYMGDYTDF